MKTFQQKLDHIVEKNNSLVCVGLDSDFSKLPEQLKKLENPQFEFNKTIIDATHNLVCAYKPNSAFYEARGEQGIHELKMTCDYITKNYPEIFLILDAKRGDIGSTNEGYVTYAFEYLKVDAITVMPYMGIESLDAFFTTEGKGIIVGCHSSNPGAKEFQELEINGKPLYMYVAEQLMKQHGNNPNCMIFMGATYPEQLKTIREVVGDMTLLVPGVGAQEGGVEQAVKMGLNSQKKGMILNASRSVIFAQNPRDEAIKLKDEINKYRL